MQYEKSTGIILGMIQSPDLETCKLQCQNTGYDLLIFDGEKNEVLELQKDYLIRNQEFILKEQIRFIADKASVIANGIDCVTITAIGLTRPTTIKINKARLQLSPDDSVVFFRTTMQIDYLIDIASAEKLYFRSDPLIIEGISDGV